MELVIALILFVGVVVSWFALPGSPSDGVSTVEAASATPVTAQTTA
jgi:hypothetical protein